MTTVRLPHLLISLGLHLAVLLVLLLAKGPQLPELRQRRVVVELSAPREPMPERTARPEDPQTAIVASEAEPLASSLDLAGPRSLATPSGRMPAEGRILRAEGPRGGQRAELLSAAPPPAVLAPDVGLRLAVPTVDEVLADLPASPSDRDGVPAAETAGAVAPGVPTDGYPGSGALEWRGRERKVVQAARPEFPEVLLQEGQEVDVEATFKVAPNGQVTHVEITRSSGYSAVDRAVERALSNYLFEASTTDEDDTGRIRFRFRLERVN